MNLLAIFQKELKSYFVSPLSYVIAGIFWLIAGTYMVGMLLGEQGLIQQVFNEEQSNLIVQPIDVPYIFFNSFFSVLGSLCMFFLPLLSVGLYTKERKRDTIKILTTSPIYNLAIALSKLLGGVTFFLFMITPLLLYEIIIFKAAEPPIIATVPLLSHFGLILFATAILSISMFIYSLIDNSFVAVIFTFICIFFIWLIDVIALNINGFWGAVLEYLSLFKSYSNLIQGIFDLSNIVLLFSYIILGIFLTAQSIENWRFTRR